MRKFIIRLTIALLISLLSLTAVASFVPVKSKAFMDILLLPVENRFETDIRFSSSEVRLPAHISMGGVSVVEENGRLYYFDTLDIYYNLIDLLLKREVFFAIKRAKLYQKMSLLNSVTDILVISELPDVEFEKIEGVFQLKSKGTVIKRFYAYNDIIRIRAVGWADKEGTLDCDVNFSFSEALTGRVPDAVKSALLKDEGGGWMGIALKVTGNYKRPSIRITGDALKVNIKELF